MNIFRKIGKSGLITALALGNLVGIVMSDSSNVFYELRREYTALDIYLNHKQLRDSICDSEYQPDLPLKKILDDEKEELKRKYPNIEKTAEIWLKAKEDNDSLVGSSATLSGMIGVLSGLYWICRRQTEIEKENKNKRK